MLKLKSFFDLHGYPQKIELLPYHRMGENKSLAIGSEPTIFDIPTKEEISYLNSILN